MGLTVKELYEACKEQIEKGNGCKTVLISGDDEGNNYHTLFQLFTDDRNEIEFVSELFQDNNNPGDVVLLG